MKTMLTEKLTWSEIRSSFFPAMRRSHPVRIVHSGGIKRVYQCALCGATISMDARWPVTVRVTEFHSDHNNAAHRVEWLVRRAARGGGSLAGMVEVCS